MAKLKTRKTISKRVTITKNGKVMKRVSGQAHFNSKESGKVTRNKRRDTQLSPSHAGNVRRLLPYS